MNSINIKCAPNKTVIKILKYIITQSPGSLLSVKVLVRVPKRQSNVWKPYLGIQMSELHVLVNNSQKSMIILIKQRECERLSSERECQTIPAFVQRIWLRMKVFWIVKIVSTFSDILLLMKRMKTHPVGCNIFHGDVWAGLNQHLHAGDLHHPPPHHGEKARQQG